MRPNLNIRIAAALLAITTGQSAVADVQAPGGRVIDCYCTDRAGGRVELDQEICLFVDGRAFMARCEMSLNNPMWRETGNSCLSSERQQSQPRLYAPLIDAKI